MLQFLAPDGSLQQPLEPPLSEAALVKLYRIMFLTRALDSLFTDVYAELPWHLDEQRHQLSEGA